jgi:hypothetical protein
MLNSLDHRVVQERDSCRRLFVNVSTGRFLWKDMPMLLRAYTCIGADHANGLLVLKAARDSELWILNPFTGHLVRLPQRWGEHDDETLTVAAEGLQTKMVYSFWNSCHAVCDGDDQDIFTAPPDLDSSATVVAFQSRAYAVDGEGTVTVMEEDLHSRLFYPSEREPAVPGVRRPAPPLSTYLVDNAGELLLVRPGTLCEGGRTIQVFRVDLEGKALHSIKSIGNRAIFLGGDRCLSVDAGNLPGIQGNCIYYVGGGSEMTRGIWVCRLEDGTREKFFSPPFRHSPHRSGGHRRSDVAVVRAPPDLPLSLPQVLLDYPKYVPRYGFGKPKWHYY